MSTSKEQKPKPVLFYISHSLFKNKRLKRRHLIGDSRKKNPKKRQKAKHKYDVNGGRFEKKNSQQSETIEIISTDEEYEPTRKQLKQMETSIVLSSGEEDEEAATSRIFPMLASETTVRTAVGNKVYELSLTNLKKKLDTISSKESECGPPNKRLSSPHTMDVSISLLSDDEEDNNPDNRETTELSGLTVTLESSTK